MYLLSVHVACSVGWRWMDVLSVHIEIGPRPATLSVWPLWRFGAKLVKCSMCWHLFVWLVSWLFADSHHHDFTHHSPIIRPPVWNLSVWQSCSNKAQQPLIHNVTFALLLQIVLSCQILYVLYLARERRTQANDDWVHPCVCFSFVYSSFYSFYRIYRWILHLSFTKFNQQSPINHTINHVNCTPRKYLPIHETVYSICYYCFKGTFSYPWLYSFLG